MNTLEKAKSVKQKSSPIGDVCAYQDEVWIDAANQAMENGVQDTSIAVPEIGGGSGGSVSRDQFVQNSKDTAKEETAAILSGIAAGTIGFVKGTAFLGPFGGVGGFVGGFMEGYSIAKGVDLAASFLNQGIDAIPVEADTTQQKSN